jgi:hypothetical protein
MADTDATATVTTLHPTASDPTPIPTPLNVTALAKRFGVDRRTIQRRLKKGWTPPAAPAARRTKTPQVTPHPVPHEVPQPMPQHIKGGDPVCVLPAREPEPESASETALLCPPQIQPERKLTADHHGGSRKVGAVLLTTACAIALLAISINAQTGWRFGTTPLASATFAGLSVAADMLAIVLPSAAVALWWNRRRLLATVAWATWVLAASMATLASIGFSSLHMGDTAAARSAIVSTAVATADRRNGAIEAARAAAAAATVARQGECQKRGPLCRDLEHAEQARMTEVQAAIATPVPTAATIADADPQVTGAVRLAQWVGLGVTATDVGNLRLALMGLLPNIAGLVLCFGMALRLLRPTLPSPNAPNHAMPAWPARRQQEPDTLAMLIKAVGREPSCCFPAMRPDR